MCLISFFILLTIHKVTSNFTLSVFLSLVATLNAYIISLQNLNPNIIGMLYCCIILFLITRETIPWFLVGLLFGVFGGVRNIAILFGPALILKIMLSSSSKRKDVLLFIIGAFIAILPILYWKQFAFGNMFMHPSQFSNHEGFRPVFEHHFLFWSFNFNGMFNFPLHTEMIRTPYFAFPTFLTIPLTIINMFGVILSAFMLIGIPASFKINKHFAWTLIIWFLPIFAIFILQENWSELKTTFLLLFMNPILIWMSFGIHALFKAKRKLVLVSTITLISLLLCIGIQSLRTIDFAVDGRWYERFPRATKSTMSYVGDDLRSQPESASEIHKQKIHLTKVNLFPNVSVPRLPFSLLQEKIRGEITSFSIQTIDYWKYIYGEDQ